MKAKPRFTLLTVALLFLFSVLYLGISTADAGQNPQEAEILESYGKLPLYFIENKGQFDPKVKFYTKTSAQTLYFTDEGIVFDLLRRETGALKDAKRDGEEKKPTAKSKKERLVFALAFDNAQQGNSIAGVEKQAAKVNYLLGNDKAKWKTDIPTYKGIVYKGVYKGIDFKVRGDGKAIKYDFIVNPGADPGDISLSYDGIEGLSANEEGELVIRTAFGELKETTPYIYQEIEGERAVDGSFEIRSIAGNSQTGKFSYGFQVASYNPSYPLIIDPTLIYSTYLGGTGNDYAKGIGIDSSGNAYVTGETSSTNFPTQNPFQGSIDTLVDAFVTKLSSDGTSLIYSTYLGGSSIDRGYSIATDSSGNAYVTGETSSTNFPTQNPFQGSLVDWNEAFITKLSSDGTSLIYSTYLGGSGLDYGRSIATGSSGNAYVTGITTSSNFPTQNPFQGSIDGTQDAFTTKLSSDGTSLIYSTYLGGSSSDSGYGIAVDSSGNAYVTGNTGSSNFPTQNPFQGSIGGGSDAFTTKLSSDGTSLIYSTYLGGSGGEVGYGIAIDSSGNAYVTGYTDSSNFPTQNPFQGSFGGGRDSFITKLSSNGTSLTYSTYLGGSLWDEGYGIAVDSSGNAYVTGNTYSSNFPTQNPFQGSIDGTQDAFTTKLSSNGTSLTYSTYLGGSSSDSGYGIAVDSSGNAYVAGTTGSINFPTQNPYQGSRGGSNDVFVLKYQGEDAAPTITSFTPTSGGTNTSVTITGTNFTGATAVTFGGTNASDFTVNSSTQITAIVGSGSTGKVTVTTPGGTFTTSSDFTYTAVTAGTYYVNNTTGDDANDGSAAHPWKTLHHAISQINGGSAGTYVLHVALGTYSVANGEANTQMDLSQGSVTIIGERGSAPIINGTNAQDWTKGLEITGSNVTVKNLYFTGFSDTNEEGVRISGGTGNEILRCNVYANNWGIRVNEASGSTIKNCDIYGNITHGIDIVQSTGTTVVYNKIHGNPLYGIRIESSPEISRNEIYDNQYGIFLDAVNGSTVSPIIKNNVIYETVSGAMSYGIFTRSNYESTVNPWIYHNTIDGGTLDGIAMEKDGVSSSAPVIKYNIITNFGRYGINNSGAGPTIEYNDVWNNTAGNYSGIEVISNTNINEDPLYGSYSLLSNSPCINKIPSSEGDPVTLDYPGFKRPRPGKTTKDMGAYEYVAKETDNYTLPGGTGVATDYRIFTVALNLGTGAGMLNAMEAVLGAYDPTHWRGFLYTGTSYSEFNSSPFASHPIIPGMGFWIITTYTNQIPFEGGPAPDGVDYVMDLEPGWHLIGLPWVSTQISLGNIKVTDGVNTYVITNDNNNLTQQSLWDFVGEGGSINGYEKRNDPTFLLQYNTGYFFKVVSPTPVRLIIPTSDAQGQSAPNMMAPSLNETTPHEDDELPPPPPGSDPIPDIRVNGQDGPVSVSTEDSVSVSIALDPGAWGGRNADWWVAARTPFDPPRDWCTYIYPGGWRPGIYPYLQTQLFQVTPSFEVLNMTLPVGSYIFYFAVDGNMDGATDATWLDFVEVNVE